jgi:chlorite dismutase
MSDHGKPASREQGPDIREKGAARDGVPQTADRRLFLQFLAFGECEEPAAVGRALEAAGLTGVVYADVHDPRGIGLLVLDERPEALVAGLRELFLKPPLALLRPRPEYAMLGRTYGSGFEPNLEDWLLDRPRRVVLGEGARWAIWYPLRRLGSFAGLPPEEQGAILREHGRVGHTFGGAGLVQDIRLACFGLDRDDNDFVLGLIGRELHPLSACVQAMRSTRQTSQYMEKMGPFFVGRTLWQSPLRQDPPRP